MNQAYKVTSAQGHAEHFWARSLAHAKKLAKEQWTKETKGRKTITILSARRALATA